MIARVGRLKLRARPVRFSIPNVFCVLCLINATTSFAQLPVARLTGVFPPGGSIGTHYEVTVTGSELDGATELRFSRPGITAKPLEGSAGGTEQRFTVSIDSSVPVGECEVRFFGAMGLSNPRAFDVSDRPETVRPTSAKRDRPFPIPLGSIVTARCTSAVADSFSVEIKAGQRALLTCTAREIDSKLSPVLTLLDRAGHEVEHSRHGGLLDFTAPSDGTYIVQVHDVLYRGGPDYFYRLQSSIGPHVDAIFPPAGRRGSKSKYALYGRNLPGGCKCDLRAVDGKPLQQLDVEIELPADGRQSTNLDVTAHAGSGSWSTDTFAYRLPSEQGTSNPILIGITESEPVVEQEPNDEPVHAQKLNVPAEVVGRFYPHDDRDWYTFDANKGDVFWIEAFAQRMGMPSSPLVLVQRVTRNDKGIEQSADVQEVTGSEVNLGGPAFRMQTRDGAYRLAVSDAGTYRLMVRDLFNTSIDNPTLTYRLSIRREQPDFGLLLLPLEGPTPDVAVWSPFLRKGGSYPMRLILPRRDGYSGPVQVGAEGLPDGLRCSDTTIPAGQNTGLLVLSAQEGASGWCGPVRIIGHAKVNDREIARDARVGAVIWPSNTGAQETAVSRVAEDFAVGISGDEQEPISFNVSEKSYEVAAGGKLQIPVRLKRNMPVNGPVKITTGGLATLAGVKELMLAPDVSAGNLEIDLAQQKLAVGTYSFFLQAQAPMTYQRRTFPPVGKTGDVKTTPQGVQATSYSPLITLNVVPRNSAKGK